MNHNLLIIISWDFHTRNMIKQAGAELGQAQVKLGVIVKVEVEDRCIYLILREF